MESRITLALIFGVFLLAGCAQAPPAEDGAGGAKPPVPPANVTPPAAIVTPPPPSNGSEDQPPYEPEITPSEFTPVVTNRFFSLTPGKRMVYEGMTQDGPERVEIYVKNETRMIQGVETIVVWDRVWLDGALIEETTDWYAQDGEGNVWYFGEETEERAGGIVTSTAGSWIHGADGAKAGIIMKAEPLVGESYRQEYYVGEAEDMADVLSLDESVSVPYGNFTGCLKTYDWTPLDLSAREHKYYCAGPGGVVKEVALEDGETLQLVSVEYGAEPTPSEPAAPAPQPASITEDEARAIALKEVPGEVTDVAIESKGGKLVYVVQIDADSGPETDVLIDMETGEVLAVET